MGGQEQEKHLLQYYNGMKYVEESCSWKHFLRLELLNVCVLEGNKHAGMLIASKVTAKICGMMGAPTPALMQHAPMVM